MVTPKPVPDETQRNSVARLTAKERECLDQWLSHATAKEIALDLGISHHAVEKRLKSARQKLGVFTTLDAARLLALVEGYGRTASHSPEVVSKAPPGHGMDAEPVKAMPTRVGRKPMIYAGAIIMSILFLVALAAGVGTVDSSGAGAQPAASPNVTVVDKRVAKAGDLEAAFAKVFAGLDKDGSGFLDGTEQTGAKLRMMRQGGAAANGQPQAVEAAQWDSNGDKRVSRAEFVAGMTSITAQIR